ncbi:MAG: type II secretion system minor pseudopilin GspK [Deltaproteobacteria bacterium]|nr:type II secretion system minor pseudopilin GspK [Deltaproteobacteria bacterium]
MPMRHGFPLPSWEREKKRTVCTQERGAALVTVLLAVTLLTVTVVEFAYSTQVDHHLAYNALKALQATYLARSGVNLALLVLKRDTQTSGIDSFGEDWAHALPPLPAGEGAVTLRVTDEQGKLNLNALRNANGTISGPWREVAERLFVLRGLDPGLLDPLLDWLDSDDFPEPRGAEKTHYLGLTPPQTPRNGPLLTLGELGRVAGFTPAIRTRLDDVVTVLPANNTKINANTAPAEVLAALFPTLDHETLEQFLSSRVNAPIHGSADLRERLGFAPRTQVDGLNFTVARSEFFSVHALATVTPVSQALKVVVQRRAATVTPISWQPVMSVVPSGGAE